MNSNYFLVMMVLLFFQSCEESSYIPKPTGFARMDFPNHEYQKFENELCPFTFDYGLHAQIIPIQAKNNQHCWMDLEYPKIKSKIHFSYYDISNGGFLELVDDARKLALKHLVKADDFEESNIRDNEAQVYGVIYDFQGNSASNYQFYLTDSVSHFIRGACKP